jgi:FkbH-like protein
MRRGSRLHLLARSPLAESVFAYPVVLRTDLSGDPGFQELLARIRAVTLAAYAHQRVPFSKVVKALRLERNAQFNPLIQVMFGFLDLPPPPMQLPGLTASPVDVEKNATDFDLFVSIFRSQSGLHGVFEYNADLFDAETVAQLADSFYETLISCVRTPDLRLSAFELHPALLGTVQEHAPTRREWTIVITATFTAEPVQAVLEFWMRELDSNCTIVFAPYNQVFQQLLDPSSLIAGNDDGITIVLLRFEDWQTAEDRRYRAVPLHEDVAQTIEKQIADLAMALDTVSSRSNTPILICMCPPSPHIPHNALFEQMETVLAARLAQLPGIYPIRSAEIMSLYPVATYYDAYKDKLGRIPYTPEFFASLATMLSRRIYAIQTQPYKVIVLDCDDTLWKGICGENGVAGIEIDASRQMLQSFMVDQYRQGMLICLCSKNNEEDIVDIFDRCPMILKREHIVSWRINWRSKSENIISLAEELHLGLDSFIFVDDSAFECAEVEANCPGVLALQLPAERDDIPNFLRHIWAFDHLKMTDEDRRRTELYKSNLEREDVRRSALNFAEFLQSLELQVVISEMQPEHITRVSQLTYRTNQFNMTTIRRSGSEIQELYASKKVDCLIIEVRDRFGDYGLVGIVLYEDSTESLHVDTFLLSCRVLGRGVEHQVLARLGMIALDRGRAYVDVFYIPTKKNKPAYDFLECVGASFRAELPGRVRFRFPASFAAAMQ